MIRTDYFKQSRAQLHVRYSVLLATFLVGLAPPVDARKGFGGGPGTGMVERRDADIRATGMTPVFAPGFVCEPIASPYGSPTRYDGSSRRDDRNGGLHGGMDLSLKGGTPLLAVARATVIAKGAGGQLEGNYLWLRVAPADTGLPFYFFVKYQHLAAVPTLNEGDTVEAGQVIAASGNSGTIGGHYGAGGYYHLHLSVTAGPSAEFEKIGVFGSMIRGRDAHFVDPLLLYASGMTDPEEVYALPDERKRLLISVADSAGQVFPSGSKTVWPVACVRETAHAP